MLAVSSSDRGGLEEMFATGLFDGGRLEGVAAGDDERAGRSLGEGILGGGLGGMALGGVLGGAAGRELGPADLGGPDGGADRGEEL